MCSLTFLALAVSRVRLHLLSVESTSRMGQSCADRIENKEDAPLHHIFRDRGF